MSPLTQEQKINCIISIVMKLNNYTTERLKSELEETQKLMESKPEQYNAVETKYFALQAKIQEVELCESYYKKLKKFSLSRLENERKFVWKLFNEQMLKGEPAYNLTQDSITLNEIQRYSLNLLVIDDLIENLKNDKN